MIQRHEGRDEHLEARACSVGEVLAEAMPTPQLGLERNMSLGVKKLNLSVSKGFVELGSNGVVGKACVVLKT